jgi:uncharacterized HAD superfamily protein
MLIAIDIDAVLADLLSMFLRYRNDTYKTNFKREDFYTNEWYRVFAEPSDLLYKILYDFFKSEYMAKVEPVPGAIAGVNRLKNEHKLVIVTSRPKIIAEETFKWIHRFFPNAFSSIYFSNQPAYNSFGPHKGEICIDVGAELFIDDQFDYGTECAKAGILTFLYDSPWNQSVKLPENMVRVRSWGEVTDNVDHIEKFRVKKPLADKPSV